MIVHLAACPELTYAVFVSVIALQIFANIVFCNKAIPAVFRCTVCRGAEYDTESVSKSAGVARVPVSLYTWMSCALCTLPCRDSSSQILYNPVSFAPFTPARLYYFSELGVTLKPCLGLGLSICDALLRLCLDAVRRTIADPCLS